MKYTLGLRKKRSRREEASFRQREDQGEKRPVISMASQRDRLTDSRKLEQRTSMFLFNTQLIVPNVCIGINEIGKQANCTVVALPASFCVS